MQSTVTTLDMSRFRDVTMFSVTLTKWGNRGKIKDMAALEAYIRELKTDPNAANGEKQVILASDRVKSTKALIKSEKYDALCKRMTEIKKYVLSRSMPSKFREGLFIVKSSEVATHEKTMRDMVEKLKAPDGELELFLASYELDVKNAETAPVKQGGLGPIFDPEDYPTVDELREMFDIEWFWLKITAADNIPPELQAEANEKFQRRIVGAIDEIETALREEFRTLLEHANERLTPDKDGEPKTFRNTLIGNIQNFIATFDSKNVFNDEALQTLVTEAKTLLLDDKGQPKLDAQRLRDNKDARATAKAAFEKMQATLDGMIVTKKRRALDLDES